MAQGIGHQVSHARTQAGLANARRQGFDGAVQGAGTHEEHGLQRVVRSLPAGPRAQRGKQPQPMGHLRQGEHWPLVDEVAA